jgi:metal-sulfur cluster biosynthetic enzyme
VIETAPTVTEQEVLTALQSVSDPELDESIVDLQFVDRVRVEDSRVELVLRLPTFWCAPNFAYLMAYDARQQVLSLPGVREVRVALKDHMYSDEITAGVSAGEPFGDVFAGQCEGDDLEDLRQLFRGKAFGMRQEQLVRALLDGGLTADEIVGLRAADVLDTTDARGLRLRISGVERLVRGAAPLARAYLARRARLGLDEATPWLVTSLEGARVPAGELQAHLQRTRRQRVSMTFNALMCRGLLETRYGLAGKEVEKT